VNRRFKTPVGEIDLVARRGRVVAFVEVKARKTGDDALYAISPENAGRVRRAAEWWLKSHAGFADKCDIRFDVVTYAPYASIRHISNAF
jgi:putative endonuclease